jgi:hypothetical protein
MPNFCGIFLFSKIQDGPHIYYGVFFASFSRSSGIRQKLQNAKIFAFSEEQTQK